MEEERRRMEDSRQNLRTEFRAAAESSGLAGFGLASAVEGGRRMEDGGMRMQDGGGRAEERNLNLSANLPIGA